MKYRDDKKLIALFAKTALLENELAEAIEAQDREHIAGEKHGLDRSFKNMVAGFLLLVGVTTTWIVYQHFQEIATQIIDLTQEGQRSATVSSETATKVQQQLDIAQQQVNATMQNAQAVRDQARLDQRAWAYLTSLTLHPLIADQPIWITANTLNNGRTFALRAKRTNVIILTTEEPTSFPKLGNWKNLGVLAPNLPYVDNFKGSEGLTQPEIDAIRSGALLVVMYGTLKYDDVFGTPRVTDYCVVYTPDSIGFSTCNKHNRVT
jgi:hypothetical protein